ncbi:MAG: hypothetical protein ACFB10_07465 [Salibacteraceae bacterium]
MEILSNLILIIVPSGVVFLTTFYILKKFFENEEKKRMVELSKVNSATLTPIRLQSYERLVLYMERITPDNLVMRTYRKGMNAQKLREDLLATIRTEFEHNLSQQIYVSKAGWELVKAAKEEVIQLINVAATKVQENDSGIELSKVVVTMTSHLDRVPTQVAIDYLKKEVGQSF